MTDMNDTTKQKVLDIAMNLNRIGNWVADDFEANKSKINVFIDNTNRYILTLGDFNLEFEDTWNNFKKKYPQMITNVSNNAENLMTWGNILTHRARLIG